LNKVKAIKVVASITGAIWYVKGKGDFLKNVILTAETRKEHLTVDFPGQDKHAIFQPNRIVIETAEGTLIEARDNPEESFAGQQRETPTYFAGEALWTYLNTPFLYTHEGFATEEIPSIQVDGEPWRRLKVTFPDNVKSHTREQISCFGPDGLLRRHDYPVDILGGCHRAQLRFGLPPRRRHHRAGQASSVCVGRRLPTGQRPLAGPDRHGRDHPHVA
jgi:hypothetical protein